jgi:hypothetical protein
MRSFIKVIRTWLSFPRLRRKPVILSWSILFIRGPLGAFMVFYKTDGKGKTLKQLDFRLTPRQSALPRTFSVN